jgi:hypothetical protein
MSKKIRDEYLTIKPTCIYDSEDNLCIFKGQLTDAGLNEIKGKKVEALSLRVGVWEDLSALEGYFEMVEKLFIFSPFVDWQAISNFKNLKYLQFGGKYKVTVDLMSLRALKELHIFAEKSVSFEQCTKLEGLKYLRVNNCIDEDLSRFKDLKGLSKLELVDAKKLSSLKGIEKLPHLKSFVIDGSSILEDFNCLNALNSLVELKILNSKNISFPERLTLKNLKHVTLTNCKKFNSVLPFASCTKLESLHIFETGVDDGDISFLEKMESLKSALIQPKRQYTLDVKNLKSELIEKYGNYEYPKNVGLDY